MKKLLSLPFNTTKLETDPEGEPFLLQLRGIRTPSSTVQIPEKSTAAVSLHQSPPRSLAASVTGQSGKYFFLMFFSVPANLILQAPLDVFEEESVVLRCRTRAKAGLNAVMLYKNGKVLKALENISDFTIHQASLKDNGIYHCTGIKEDGHYVSSNSVEIQVQGLFPPPVLTASPTYPIEGRAVTLTCLTQPVPQRPDVQLQFQFLRDNWTLESDWRSSPEFQITTVWREDSRSSYWCQARRVTSLVQKKSQRFQMYVQRVTAKIRIYTYPELALEGQKLVIICSVGGIQEPITFFWYKKTNKLSRRTKIHTSSEREFRIPVLTDSHAGEYCCVARNRHYSFFSDLVTVSVKVPVSPPILTLSPLGARTLEGDVVTLLCEVQRGSLPISYQLFHKGVLLKKIGATSWRTISFQLFLTEEHSGNYYCTADNGLGPQHSKAMSLSVFVPVSRPVLTLRTPRAQTVEGDMVELHCEAQRGSPPIQYQLFHKDVALGSSSSPSGGGATFNLFLKEEHSGNYICQANNGLRVQHSDTVSLSVRVPVSRPVLTLRTPRAQAVEGDVVELHCEAQRGSSPILYQFFHEDVALGSRSSPSGGGAPFNLSLTAEHSGNYSCKADNGLGAQRSEVMTLSVIVPVSRPVLTLKVPGAQAVEGDMVELLCEAQRGSPPILYRFYHENVTLESSVSHSGQGVSFNLSVTAEHSGNYSCEVDNGLGPQCSEAVTLHITGLTGSRIGPVATGVTGGLLSIMGLAAVALLLYGWPLRKAGRRPTSNSSSGLRTRASQEHDESHDRSELTAECFPSLHSGLRTRAPQEHDASRDLFTLPPPACQPLALSCVLSPPGFLCHLLPGEPDTRDASLNYSPGCLTEQERLHDRTAASVKTEKGESAFSEVGF
ncbi:Fc receptor-like protein 5 [Camelus ferus]|nr:Fc receptor-like protein 5 [Camelus ferus]